MASHKIKNCRSCQAPIIFLKTKSDKWMPVDADTVDMDVECLFDKDVHSSHFDTCANAAKHRKNQDEKKAAKPEQQTLGTDDGSVPF